MSLPANGKSLVVLLSSRDDINPIKTSLSLLAATMASGEIPSHQAHVLVMTDSRPRKELVSAVGESGVPATFLHLGRLRLVLQRVIWLLAYRLRVPLISRFLSRHRSLLSTYLPKVRKALDYAQRSGFDLIVKCDDDAILSPVAWRVLLLDSRSHLQSDECILVTPALSSGIPTWVDYADLMMSPAQRSLLLSRLREVDLPRTCWGVDYTEVLAAQCGTMWDEAAHQAAMGALEHPYKGFHPIRFDAEACVDLIEVALMNLDTFLQKIPADAVIYRACSEYLCNVVFAITPDKYRHAIGNDARLIDPFDEVPINELVREKGNYFLVATNAPALHLLYNSAYGQPVDFEGLSVESRELEIRMASSLALVLKSHGATAPTSDR